MYLNNVFISVNLITRNLFFYFFWDKVKRSELGLEERDTSPKFKRYKREALNLSTTPMSRRQVTVMRRLSTSTPRSRNIRNGNDN